MIMINNTIMIYLDISTISSGCPQGNFLEELFKMPRNSRGVPKMACRFNPFSDNASVLLFVNVLVILKAKRWCEISLKENVQTDALDFEIGD